MSPDHQLIQSIANGDKEAFRLLYQQYSAKVYNIAISYLKNEKDAEEITQDVFTTIFKKAANFRGDAAVNTWVYRMTVNASINLSKKRKRSTFLRWEAVDSDQIDFVHPGVLAERKEESQMLFKVIDTLPHNQKTAFILSYVEDLPRQEIADIMELSLKAIESLLQRAKKNLREKLKKRYPNRRK